MTVKENVEKIVSYKTWSDKRKIDALLEIDCNLYANLGKESTLTEKREVKRTSKFIYKHIAQMNPAASYLVTSMDEIK